MSSEPVIHGVPPRRKTLVATGVGLAIAAAIVITGVTLRAVDAAKLKNWTEARAIPSVTVIQAVSAKEGSPLELPGRLQAFTTAPIYAQVSGYLKSWSVDIGDRVTQGQLLAVIDTPELDQQLLQAKADLESATADESLAKTTAARWQALLGSDSVSRQEVDDRTADATAKIAKVRAAQANVDRLMASKAFARITAPFSGVVTARNTDVGALINTGSGAGLQLFTVSDVSRLRVYVRVPQDYAALVRSGTTALLTVPDHPGEKFTTKIIGLADAVNAESGTTLVQLLVDNSDRKLLPGGYAMLHFTLPLQGQALRIPATALIFDDHGTRVATVDANNRVEYRTVAIKEDLGSAVEIGSGLQTGERVIDTPPDGLTQGDVVQVVTTPAGKKKASAHE
ncbi:RND family efflux transporter MFP subunit [Paraburkholderia sp. GAS199]|uniref:efflux RND transporter periplasmic adaptor subunit n=1 Tax=Paraburkholderia sp. GAS199 TaxID=3035126 RepID=UPI003D1DB625